ncbi:MAG: hypothetical protein NVS1B7_0670 [Candidatus Saccharimonadales bacterium]
MCSLSGGIIYKNESSGIILIMNDTLDCKALWANTRAQVYLLWAVLTGVGYVATHYYQNPNINIVWIILSVIGLGYMAKVMPLQIAQMKKIFLAWLVPIIVGIAVSGLAVHTQLFPQLVGYLGAFWLVVMAVGYVSNGIVDQPSTWYYVAAALNLLAALLIYTVDQLVVSQYLIVAVISVWSMLNLWIFRSE